MMKRIFLIFAVAGLLSTGFVSCRETNSVADDVEDVADDVEDEID